MPLRSPMVIVRAPISCSSCKSVCKTRGSVEAGVGSALLKLGLSKMRLPRTGLTSRRARARRRPSARSLVLTRATVDIPAAAVGSVVGVGWGVGASCGFSVAAGEVGEPVGDGSGVPADVGER